MKTDQSIFVSIIMPTFNRAGYIIESIESIRKQTYTNWELIIADDGSDDETKQLVQNIQDSRIQFLEFAHCGVGGKIKNNAIKKASGDLIAFNDSDDLWDPVKLEKQVEALHQFSTAGFCVTNGYNFTSPAKAIEFFYKRIEGYKYGELFISYFQSELAGFTQALIVRKECLEFVGGFKEIKSFSDADLILELAYTYSGIILYEPLVYRRLHNLNHTRLSWKQDYKEEISLIRQNRNRLPASIYNSTLTSFHLNRGEKFYRAGIRKKALKNFVMAWKYSPFSLIPLRKIAKSFLP